jgi:hypothetical protein
MTRVDRIRRFTITGRSWRQRVSISGSSGMDSPWFYAESIEGGVIDTFAERIEAQGSRIEAF